jgi:hypothetical protein
MSCHGNSAESADEVAAMAVSPMDEMKSESPEAQITDSSTSDDIATNTASEAKAQNLPQQLIKTADVSINVAEYKESKQKLLQLIKSANAVITSDQETNDSYRTGSNIMIRVPKQKFDSLLNAICDLAKFVNSRNVMVQDVTEEFVDIQARLKNKMAVEAQYTSLLKQAKNISEILEVEEHLRIIREEIDSKEGRLKYLRSQVSLSTINLSVYQEYSSPTYSVSFFDKIFDAFSSGWAGLLSFILGLINIWPFLIIFVVSIWWFVKHRKNKAGKNPQKNIKDA